MIAKPILVLLFIHSLFCLSGCAQTTHETEPDYSVTYIDNPEFLKISGLTTPQEKDHAAILAMQGEFAVNFDFQETVILASGYTRFPPKEASAREVVIVVEESPEHIVLQHILVVGHHSIVKHWRQDWTYETRERFEFSNDQTWTVNSIEPKISSGQWTQCVYEVSDAPRYCGTGKWKHRDEASTWESDLTWRPLPRREYTVRDDYNALSVVNRHTVTRNGWSHEQDNAKVQRSGKNITATLVREFGFNDYRSISNYDFSPAYKYWQKTAAYWEKVRSVWSEHFDRKGQVILDTPVDGMPVVDATFSQATAIQEGARMPSDQEVYDILAPWVNTTIEQANTK